jgi:hypothetical protein
MKRREPMRLRSDILRGVRLAALAFVLVLLGALVYRSVDIAAKNRTGPVPQVVVTPATTPAPTPAVTPETPAPPPSQAVPKQGGLIAQVRGTGVRPAANPSIRKASASGSQAEQETADSAAQPSEPPHTDTVAADKAEEAQADPPEETVTPAVANPTEASAEAAPAENRGKRMIKAVGRFLRIGGKKDVEPQPAAPARPKPNQQ